MAKSYEERKVHSFITMREFRLNKWVGDGGIFGELVKDDYAKVAGLVNSGDNRLKIPLWHRLAREEATVCLPGIV